METVFVDDPDPEDPNNGEAEHHYLFGPPNPEQSGHSKWHKKPNHHLFHECLWTTYSGFPQGLTHPKQKV